MNCNMIDGSTAAPAPLNPYVSSSTAISDASAVISSSSSCTCTEANILRLDNDPKGLHVDIHRGLFSTSKKQHNDASDCNWYEKLLANVRWHRVKYKSNRFQKDCETPCWTAFYGGRSEYSPYTPVPSWFQPLIDQVTTHLGKGVRFNAFLLRLYFDGNDEIAWHTDGRTFLGDEPTIASLSLGCKATFQLRRMNNVWPCADGSKSTEGCVDVNTPIESFVLSDGDLLVMRGTTQKHWHHRVPKEKGRGVRLNINFRYVMPGSDAERGQKTYYKYMVYGDCPVNSEPPSWTFNEIMAKRGGIMNFVQRGMKRKSVEVDGQSTVKDRDMSSEDEGKKCKAVDSSAQYAKSPFPSNEDDKSNNNCDSETQQYLASNDSIDIDVYMALPKDIQTELLAQWKSHHHVESSQTNKATATATKSNITVQEIDCNNTQKEKCNNETKSAIEKKSRGSSQSRKGTLHSFFVKK